MAETRTEDGGTDGWGEEALYTRDLSMVRGALRRSATDVDAILERLHLIPRVLRAQNTRLGSPLGEDALDDLAQDVFVIVWRKLESYDGRKPIEAWAYRICRLELMNGVRRSARNDTSDMHPDFPEPSRPGAADFDEVYRALETLPAEEASIVRLKHMEELTFAEIGERLAISANTAKTRYYRGLSRMEAFFEEREKAEGQATRVSQRAGGNPGER